MSPERHHFSLLNVEPVLLLQISRLHRSLNLLGILRPSSELLHLLLQVVVSLPQSAHFRLRSYDGLVLSILIESNWWWLSEDLRLWNTSWDQILSVESKLSSIPLQGSQLVEQGIVLVVLVLQNLDKLILLVLI